MKHFNFYSTVLFTILFSALAAQTQPGFIIKNGLENYEMHLDVANENIDSIFINGFYSEKGTSQNFSYKLSAKELFKKKNPNTKIHNLNNNVDYAFYSIRVKGTDGQTNYYPSVKVNMPFSNILVQL